MHNSVSKCCLSYASPCLMHLWSTRQAGVPVTVVHALPKEQRCPSQHRARRAQLPLKPLFLSTLLCKFHFRLVSQCLDSPSSKTEVLMLPSCIRELSKCTHLQSDVTKKESDLARFFFFMAFEGLPRGFSLACCNVPLVDVMSLSASLWINLRAGVLWLSST